MAGNELTTVPDQLGEKERSRGEGEGEEKMKAEEEPNVTAFLALNPEQMKEDCEEKAECHVPDSKNKPGRVQSVFSLVRDQIRGQPGREASRTGMLQLVQQVTRQLERTKVEQGVSEDTSPRTAVQEVQDETPADLEYEQTKEESKKDDCIVLLQEILNSIEDLRKEVGDELNLLRQESRSSTDKVLQELEARLKITANTLPSAANTVPPLPGVSRRRILKRTLTTMVPKTSAAHAFRPRCMSEPVGGRNAETASTRSSVLPTSNLQPLLPSLVVTQHATKPVRSKPRMNKPAS